MGAKHRVKYEKRAIFDHLSRDISETI